MRLREIHSIVKVLRLDFLIRVSCGLNFVNHGVSGSDFRKYNSQFSVSHFKQGSRRNSDFTILYPLYFCNYTIWFNQLVKIQLYISKKIFILKLTVYYRVVAKKFVCQLAYKLKWLKKARSTFCCRCSQCGGRYRRGYGDLPWEILKIFNWCPLVQSGGSFIQKETTIKEEKLYMLGHFVIYHPLILGSYVISFYL